jgi:hypothetical protein
MATVTPQEALIYLMVVVSASDRDMTDSELAAIGRVVQSLPVFQGFDKNRVLPVARECQKIVHRDNGLATVLAIVADTLPERLHDTAYAVAVDIAAADLLERMEELRVLRLLREQLDIDKETAVAIHRAALARHRRLT